MGECWNNGEINGHDLGEVVRDFLRVNGFERLSIAEVLWSEGREGVAEATVFFSHIQKLPVQTALKTLREASKVYRKQMGVAPKFFIDYLCIRQAQKGDFDLPKVREAIHTTPLLLVELATMPNALLGLRHQNTSAVRSASSKCLLLWKAASKKENRRCLFLDQRSRIRRQRHGWLQR